MMHTIVYAALFSPAFLCATYFGNPGEPALLTDGLLKSPPSWYCLRGGYMADYLYRQSYKDEFVFRDENPPAYVQLQTNAATITLNFKNRIDLNAILGSSQIQLDQEIFTKRQFAWGVGAKLINFSTENFYCALDLKYLESAQKPIYLLSDGYAYNVVSDYKLNYTEMQAAFGAAYRVDQICPYIYLSYLYSKIQPVPLSLLVQIPETDTTYETTSHSVITKRRWGMAVGGTFFAGAKGSLTVESRFFNQNAVNISGEVRF